MGRSHHLSPPPFPTRRPRRLRRHVDRTPTMGGLRPCGTALPDPASLHKTKSGSACRLLYFRSSSDGVHFYCGWSIRTSAVLSGGASLHPSVTNSRDRESCKSVEQTFTVVVVSFMIAPSLLRSGATCAKTRNSTRGGWRPPHSLTSIPLPPPGVRIVRNSGREGVGKEMDAGEFRARNSLGCHRRAASREYFPRPRSTHREQRGTQNGVKHTTQGDTRVITPVQG